ncbi:hypothetical protein [Nodularia sp. NIES-3585]|jgi:hypothetical protein|uniref:hypothetical protein n=1 Tax=Nodularia sp. NIES-3585 TaxID=1973477 RepID=UPI000B5C4CAA|nr:hypothetical protein [Nodularia sp. NIES-3585]GAX39022.1 hypothetical protein NIES3585_50740 [Nodularia sp. NIES-3585]
MYKKNGFLTKFIGLLVFIVSANYLIMGLYDTGYNLALLADWIRENELDKGMINFINAGMIHIELIMIVSFLLALLFVWMK